MKLKNKYNYYIEVDGGINLETAKLVKENGCEVVVAGNFIFKSSERKELIKKLMEI